MTVEVNTAYSVDVEPFVAVPGAALDQGAAAMPWLSLEQVASIAHDMRTPLATITTSAELLELELGNEDSARLVSVIQRQTHRLQRMIQDLAEYLRCPSEVLVLRQEPVDLTDLTKEVVAEIRAIGGAHHLALEVPISGMRASVDPEKVRRILQNLICNALQYSRRGSTVFVRLYPDESRGAVFEVEDEGPGVPEAAREEIFRPFVRLDDSCRGQGLGLHIVRRFATAHGGNAWVESGAIGARFCVSLPAQGETLNL
jgi:signal transduction histidine kinase